MCTLRTQTDAFFQQQNDDRKKTNNRFHQLPHIEEDRAEWNQKKILTSLLLASLLFLLFFFCSNIWTRQSALTRTICFLVSKQTKCVYVQLCMPKSSAVSKLIQTRAKNSNRWSKSKILKIVFILRSPPINLLPLEWALTIKQVWKCVHALTVHLPYLFRSSHWKSIRVFFVVSFVCAQQLYAIKKRRAAYLKVCSNVHCTTKRLLSIIRKILFACLHNNFIADAAAANLENDNVLPLHMLRHVELIV